MLYARSVTSRASHAVPAQALTVVLTAPRGTLEPPRMVASMTTNAKIRRSAKRINTARIRPVHFVVRDAILRVIHASASEKVTVPNVPQSTLWMRPRVNRVTPRVSVLARMCRLAAAMHAPTAGLCVAWTAVLANVLMLTNALVNLLAVPQMSTV